MTDETLPPPDLAGISLGDFQPEGEPVADPDMFGPQTTERPTVPKRPNTALKKNLEQTYAAIGMTVFAFDQYCGKVIVDQSVTLAASMDELARANPAVKKVLERLVETSAWGMVLSAHMPIVLAVLAHHGSPDGIGGRVTALMQTQYGAPTGPVSAAPAA